MKNPLKADSSMSIGLLLARVPIGAFFLLLGIQKLRAGVEHFASHYGGNIPAWANHQWGTQYLHALPYAEVVVGAMLIIGLLTRLGSLVAALMVVTFIIGATGVMAKDLPFHPNMIYLGVLLLLFLAGPGRLSVDGLLFGRKRVKGLGAGND